MKSHTNHGASVRRLRWSTLYFDGKTGEMTSTLCTSASGFASQDVRQLSRADCADAAADRQAGALAPPHRDADVTHEVSPLPHKSPFVLATHAGLFSMHERLAREMSMPVQTRDRTLNTPRIIRNDLH